MHEWMAKYRTSLRRATHRMIDQPVILFLGLTLSDFGAGVITTLLMTLFWDSGLAILCALPLGLLVSLGARVYRERFPRRFLVHWGWALGIARIKGAPSLFSKRRWRVFGP